MQRFRLFAAALLMMECLAPLARGGEPAGAPEFNVPPRPAGSFQLLDGDRVVFVGDTLVERAQNTDYLEAFLTARYPDRNVIYRNLGWSGDTVFGDARAGFGIAADGFAQLRQQVFALKPTVIFVGYGGNMSFDGSAGLERFTQGLTTLLDMLATTKAEMILVSPVRHEDLGRPLPDPASHNLSLELYTESIKKIARERGCRFIDLFHGLAAPEGTGPRGPLTPLTDNGIHLSPYGYWRAAQVIERALELPPDAWEVTIDASERRVTVKGAKTSGLAPGNGPLKFTLTDDRLPEPVFPGRSETGRKIRVRGLPTGSYRLKIDGQAIVTANAGEWSAGRLLRSGPEFDQVDRLRFTIMAKNRLYFYRWRPQNETYLFGFRKHEQGQNAREIPMFDPLVSEQEAKIATLRKPVPHVYEIVPDR